MGDHVVIIFEKDGRFASMAADKGPLPKAIVGRFDARLSERLFHQYAETLEAGLEMLEVNARISEDRGWKRAYSGRRNFG